MKKLIALLVILVVVVGCSSDKKKSSSTTTSPKADQGKVVFTACGDAECATIQAPMDYENPKGRKIDLALVRLPAIKPSERIGVILVNPGGPGGSGVDFVSGSFSYAFPSEVRDKFDIIGWDPRGVGQSTHVQCAKSLDPLFEDIDYSPDDTKELEALRTANQWFVDKCTEKDAELLPFLATKYSVQDMDHIRKKLGEKQINYLGFSYGTVLGQLYAHKYPENFRAMVLDGVVDVGADPKDVAVQQTVGFESVLNSFFAHCRREGCEYAQGRDPKTVFEELLASVDAHPMSSDYYDMTLGPAQFDLGTTVNLYGGELGWDALDSALTDVREGDPIAMLMSFELYVGRDTDGSYNGMYSAFLQIGCADGNIGDEEDLTKLADSVKDEAPVFGESGIYLGLPCATWPDSQPSVASNVDATGSNKILVIGTTGDPATPVQWARNAAQQLKTGVYLEYQGEGHTAYGRGDACVNSAVNQYLLTLETNPGVVCN